mgnify:CR=1 FL=1
MINNRHREKLLNALVYFTSNVNHAGKTKLFKLLYSMDFLHFEKTGRSVTGLKYFAWEKGPVPVELYDEWKSPARDFNEALTRTTKKISEEMTAHRLSARAEFNDIYFSEFQLSLMEELAKKHFNDTAEQMSMKSHEQFRPWSEVYEIRGQPSAEIPYDLMLLRRGNERDMELLSLAREYEAIGANYQ